MALDKFLQNIYGKFASRAKERGFEPPYVALIGGTGKNFKVVIEEVEFRFYHDDGIIMTERGETMTYLLTMPEYRRLRAQKAALARWSKE